MKNKIHTYSPKVTKEIILNTLACSKTHQKKNCLILIPHLSYVVDLYTCFVFSDAPCKNNWYNMPRSGRLSINLKII